MRKPDDIQRAHDILAAIALGEVPAMVNEEDMRALKGSLDALCWVLRHDHNQTFEQNLNMIVRTLEDAGFRLKDTGKLTPGSEPS